MLLELTYASDATLLLDDLVDSLGRPGSAAGVVVPVLRRCCMSRNWPARCQSTGSSPADAIRHWSTEGDHPIEDLTAEDGLTRLPSWAPSAKAISDD